MLCATSSSVTLANEQIIIARSHASEVFARCEGAGFDALGIVQDAWPKQAKGSLLRAS